MPTVPVASLARFARERPKFNSPDLSVTYRADFSGAAEYEINLTLQNQQRTFGVPQSLFMDNGDNPNNVEVYVKGTGYQFTVPAYGNGMFPVDAIENDTLVFTSAGGSTSLVVITIFNFAKPSAFWSTIDPLSPGFDVQAVLPAETSLTNRNNSLALGVAENVFPAVAQPRYCRFKNLSDFVVWYRVGAAVTGTFAAGDSQLNPGQEIILPYRTANLVSMLCSDGAADIEAEEWTV